MGSTGINLIEIELFNDTEDGLSRKFEGFFLGHIVDEIRYAER